LFKTIKRMKQTVLKYGVISGIIAMGLMTITMALHDHIPFEMGMLIGYIGITLSFIIIYPAMVSYRDKTGNGTISFGRCMSIGLLISLLSSLFYVAAWAVIYHTTMHDYLDKYAALTIEHMQKAGKSAAEISKAGQEMAAMKENYKNPVIFTLYTLMEPLPVGILVTLISAIIMVIRNKKKAPQAA
jgi:Protein of unknown function (DUF4199)